MYFAASVSVGCRQSSSGPTTDSTSLPPASTSVSMPRAEKRSLAGETSETKALSNTELQRLVLLEQLSYTRLKKRLLMEQEAVKLAARQTTSVLVEQQCDSEFDFSYLQQL